MIIYVQKVMFGNPPLLVCDRGQFPEMVFWWELKQISDMQKYHCSDPILMEDGVAG